MIPFKTICFKKKYLINDKRSVNMIQSQRETKFLHGLNLQILRGLDMVNVNPLKSSRFGTTGTLSESVEFEGSNWDGQTQRDFYLNI